VDINVDYTAPMQDISKKDVRHNFEFLQRYCKSEPIVVFVLVGSVFFEKRKDFARSLDVCVVHVIIWIH